MRMRISVIALVCASGVTLAQKPPVFMRSSCAADLSTIPNTTECGNLIVDETRGSASSRRIAIPVVILKASKPRDLPPVVFLHGGPGGGIVSRLAAMMQQPGPKSWIGVDQDWIFLDQRGGRLAAPSLDCGSLALNDAGLDNDSSSAALRACGQRWTAIGTDLSRYNAVEVAADIEDLRSTLGIKTFDVFGVSYGTRIALEVVRAK